MWRAEIIGEAEDFVRIRGQKCKGELFFVCSCCCKEQKARKESTVRRQRYYCMYTNWGGVVDADGRNVRDSGG